MQSLSVILIVVTYCTAIQVVTGPWKYIYETKPWYINDHTIIYGPGDKWHLFGITHTDPADGLCERNMAHATSDSLTGTFHREPYAMSAKLPEQFLWAPHTILYKDQYHMFYCGGGIDREKYLINHALSLDLWSWNKTGTLFTAGIDGRDPMVLDLGEYHKPRFIMYFCGTSPNQLSAPTVHHVTYFRTSDDLEHWSEPGIAFDAVITDYKGGGPTESPFVVMRGPHFYLFSGAFDTYTGTRVFYSKDPTNFGSLVTGTAMQVGQVTSHAPEVMRDTDGKWYVSSAGWGMGGVQLAELKFDDGCDACATSLPKPTHRDLPPVKFDTNIKKQLKSSNGSDWTMSSTGLHGGSPLGFGFFTSAIEADNINCTSLLMLKSNDGNPGCDTNTTFIRVGSAAILSLKIQDPNNPTSGYVVGLYANEGIKLVELSSNKAIASKSIPIAIEVEYTLNVVSKGNQVQVLLDDQLVLEYSGLKYTKGFVGLGVWQASATFHSLICV